jgi:hypothetical protein
MQKFKFFTKEKINQSYPLGILNGYYNHNMTYDELRPYHKSCCGVDIYSEVEATTYEELMDLEKWVTVLITGVLIDGVVYHSKHTYDDWEFPENWFEDKKYIYEFIIITHQMLNQADISDDAWNEVLMESYYDETIELPQREYVPPMPPNDEGVNVRMTDRLVMLEDIITYDI